ncbi:CDP-alcohol phosphatidyltransferase family protein [Effusibacillus lacus]|uniref:CDP-diacylglycerol--glycerol-3-phosphate 3-phosphatidyltransferase n=1 Tax=Effusibacillus lacus TaxID=1348429 RepID=A0A292YL55_9BACL|nr:CDP-alcohol phosphatidyltransferase family protein [Effusibacillus lacus]TCS71791.1 cardiolipin synthase [Effusibacillus lacus]GAX89641.1 CDP-diacylglycerol--glycerol-3-phosphate 3-phosphatidyltransferase [Effusibacillus lacus]
MNLPNVLTMIRLGLVPLYFIAFFSDSSWNMAYALGILALAGLTDLLDGYLARKYNWITPLGIILDPLADKLMMLAVILSFILDGRISWWAAGLLIIRDVAMIVVSAFFHTRGKRIVPAVWWGKLTTVLYYITVVAIMFKWKIAIALLWSTITMSFITSFVYIHKFRAINR